MSPGAESTNSDPTSTTSTRGQSTHSSATPRWRRIRNYIFPHFHEAEAGTTLSRRPSSDDLSDVGELDLMSGGLPKDNNSHNDPGKLRCGTDFCNTPIVRDFAVLDKPLPSPPLIDVVDNEMEDNELESLRRSHVLSMMLREGENAEDARKALVPPPLNIGRKRAQNSGLRTSSLSPLMGYDGGPPRLHTEQLQASPSSPKRFGSVRNARLAAEARLAAGASRSGQRHGPLSSTTSTPCLYSQSQLPWRSALASCPNEEYFVNPRKAPSPPCKKVSSSKEKGFIRRLVTQGTWLEHEPLCRGGIE